MNDQEKNEQIVTMMKLLEDIDELKHYAEVITTMSFEELTPAAWQGVQHIQQGVIVICGFLKNVMSQGSKIIDNDALYAHLTTVLEAQE